MEYWEIRWNEVKNKKIEPKTGDIPNIGMFFGIDATESTIEKLKTGGIMNWQNLILKLSQ